MKLKIIIRMLLLFSCPVFALIPDNSAARRQLFSLLQAPVSQISVRDEQVIQSRFAETPVRFEIERQGEKLYLIFKNERQGDYPLIGSGNVIIRRSLVTGDIEQVKIFLDDIGALVMRITPLGRRSLLSLSLFDDLLYEKLALGVGMEQVLEMDIAALIDLSAGRIPWQDLFPPDDRSIYQPLITIINEMRSVLPHLPDAEDGAMDAQGRLVQIETNGLASLPGFNCSGFAKFVVDGIYAQLTGSLMDIVRLKQKHPDLRGNDISFMYEDSRDPYFGLDWTRNIAAEIAGFQQGQQVHPESSDLRNLRFYSYQEDMGYAMSELTQVLYLRSIQSPGRLYLGSINGEFGSSPRLWQHYHVVVLYPYFDDGGNFRIAVMERNQETSVASLKRRYPQQFIHLVEILPEDSFTPPQFLPRP